MSPIWSRRRFLQVVATAGGGMLVGIGSAAAESAGDAMQLLGEDLTALGPWVKINADGSIVIGARAPDMGQGTHTALARLVAEELEADWSQVTVQAMALGVVTADDGAARFLYGPQDARGSTTMAQAWDDMRQIGSAARTRLLRAAAARWKLPVARLQAQDSFVLASDGRRLRYAELAAEAARIEVDRKQLPPPSTTGFELIGKPAGDVDAEAMVQGRQRFTIDRGFGDMLVAVASRCPFLDGKLVGFDDSETRKIPGVVDVLSLNGPDGSEAVGTAPLAASVVVLAQSTWAALRGRQALKIEWQQRRFAKENSADLEAAALAAFDKPTVSVTVRRDGDFPAAVEGARDRLEATYTAPFLAHATMEPLSCLVRLGEKRAEIVAATQDPAAAFRVVSRLTGLEPSAIDIHFPRMGGGFGRRLDHDHVAEAVRLAQAADKPIKLMWTRDEDLVHDTFRPFAVQRMEASIDHRNRISGWRHQLASTSRNAGRGVGAEQLWMSEIFPDALPAGLIPNYQAIWLELKSGVTRGNWRAPGHNVTALATECFLDELAEKLRRDPLELRLALLGQPRRLPYRGFGGPTLDTGRMAAVLEATAKAIDWSRKRRNGNGLGLACHYTFGSYAAHAFEVSTRHGKLRFHRAVCAVDVGQVVNPLGLEAQIAGATLDGISAALGQQSTVGEGRIEQRELGKYGLARLAELPKKVEVIAIESDATPTGGGEVGLPGAAPALLNAIRAATTVRIRRLPLLPELERLL